MVLGVGARLVGTGVLRAPLRKPGRRGGGGGARNIRWPCRSRENRMDSGKRRAVYIAKKFRINVMLSFPLVGNFQCLLI